MQGCDVKRNEKDRNAAASDAPSGRSSPPVPAEQAARPIASRDAASTADIFSSFVFIFLVFLIFIPPFFNRYPLFEPIRLRGVMAA